MHRQNVSEASKLPAKGMHISSQKSSIHLKTKR